MSGNTVNSGFMSSISSSASFAEKWRKRQACDRCRRIKVRCEYDSLDNPSCRRCSKAKVDCTITTPASSNTNNGEDSTNQRKSRKRPNNDTAAAGNNPTKKSSVGKYAWVERLKLHNEPIQTSDERNDKVAELKSIISDSWVEIHRLEKLKVVESGGSMREIKDYSHSKLLSDDPLSPKFEEIPEKPHADSLYREKNCVKAAIKARILSAQDARYYYDTFFKGMAEFINTFLPLSISSSLDIASEEQPILTLSMIAACATATSQDYAAELNNFLKRIYAENIVMDETNSLEIVKALLVTAFFLKPRPHPKSPIMLLYLMAYFLGIGMAYDTKALISGNVDNQEELECLRERTRLFLSMYCVTASFALFIQKMDIFNLLAGSCELNREALLKNGTEEDLKLIYMSRLMALGHEALESIKESEVGHQAFETTTAKVEHYKTKLREIAELLYLNENAKTQLSPVYLHQSESYHQNILLVIHEYVLSELVLHYDDSKEGLLVTVCYAVVGAAQRLVDLFVELAESESVLFPKLVFYKPLQAIVAMIRVRIIMWSKHLTLQKDVQDAFNKVKRAWERIKMGSFTGVEMYKMLLQVEKWLEFTKNPERLGKDKEVILRDSASKVLRAVIHNVLINKVTDNPGGPPKDLSIELNNIHHNHHHYHHSHNHNDNNSSSSAPPTNTSSVTSSSLDAVEQPSYTQGKNDDIKNLLEGNFNNNPGLTGEDYDMDAPMLDPAQMEALLTQLFNVRPEY